MPCLSLVLDFTVLRAGGHLFQDREREKVQSLENPDDPLTPRPAIPPARSHQPQWPLPPDATHADILPTPHLRHQGNQARNFESLPLLHLLSAPPDRK